MINWRIDGFGGGDGIAEQCDNQIRCANSGQPMMNRRRLACLYYSNMYEAFAEKSNEHRIRINGWCAETHHHSTSLLIERVFGTRALSTQPMMNLWLQDRYMYINIVKRRKRIRRWYLKGMAISFSSYFFWRRGTAKQWLFDGIGCCSYSTQCSIRRWAQLPTLLARRNICTNHLWPESESFRLSGQIRLPLLPWPMKWKTISLHFPFISRLLHKTKSTSIFSSFFFLSFRLRFNYERDHILFMCIVQSILCIACIAAPHWGRHCFARNIDLGSFSWFVAMAFRRFGAFRHHRLWAVGVRAQFINELAFMQHWARKCSPLTEQCMTLNRIEIYVARPPEISFDFAHQPKCNDNAELSIQCANNKNLINLKMAVIN